MYELKKKLESYLPVNLLGPGLRLIKKEFTGPRSHRGWETLFNGFLKVVICRLVVSWIRDRTSVLCAVKCNMYKFCVCASGKEKKQSVLCSLKKHVSTLLPKHCQFFTSKPRIRIAEETGRFPRQMGWLIWIPLVTAKFTFHWYRFCVQNFGTVM